MGAFFENLQVRASDPEPVIAALRAANALPAFVTTSHEGWVGAFPSALIQQNLEQFQRLAQAVSLAGKAEVLGFFVHDSDVFHYVLFKAGALLDEYDSSPGYFRGSPEAAPSGGNLQAILPLCRVGTKPGDLEKILKGRRVPGSKLPQALGARALEEFQKQKAEMKRLYPDTKRQLEAIGAPVPSLEEMLRKFDDLGKMFTGAEHQSIVAEQMVEELAKHLGLPTQWAIAGYNDFKTTPRLPVWAKLINA